MKLFSCSDCIVNLLESTMLNSRCVSVQNRSPLTVVLGVESNSQRCRRCGQENLRRVSSGSALSSSPTSPTRRAEQVLRGAAGETRLANVLAGAARPQRWVQRQTRAQAAGCSRHSRQKNTCSCSCLLFSMLMRMHILSFCILQCTSGMFFVPSQPPSPFIFKFFSPK